MVSYLEDSRSAPAPLTQTPDSWSPLLSNELARRMSVMMRMMINSMMEAEATTLRDHCVPAPLGVTSSNPYQPREAGVIILI